MVLWAIPYKPFPNYFVLLHLEHWKCVDQSQKAALSLVLFPSFDTHLQILICVLPSPAAIQVPKTDHSCGTITCIAECV